MYKELIKQAIAAREGAYSPYSHFQVGAALLTAEGRMYSGCNIENASYSATCCAERTALFNAVSHGERKVSAIAIVGAPEGAPLDYCPPCGVCRQALSEFSDDGTVVILAKSESDYKVYSIGELLPLHFGSDSLRQD